MAIKSTYMPRRTFLVLDDALPWREVSLEAVGLWVHIESRGAQVIGTEELQKDFPDRDVGALCTELLRAGFFFDADEPQPDLPEDMSGRPDDDRPRPKMPGYVYVIETQGYFKVGTTRDIAKRRKQLQTGHFETLVIVWSRRVADPAALELRLHTILHPLRKSGEWFACTREQLDQALSLGIIGHDAVT